MQRKPPACAARRIAVIQPRDGLANFVIRPVTLFGLRVTVRVTLADYAEAYATGGRAAADGRGTRR